MRTLWLRGVAADEVCGVRARSVQIGVLSAIVLMQALLIGLDARRVLQAFRHAAACFSLAESLQEWLSLGPAGLASWVAGMLPFAIALALGAAAVWGVRAVSGTAVDRSGLGRAAAVLLLAQSLLLALWFWLLPAPAPIGDWENDGLAYAVLLLLTAAGWVFCNAMLLWWAVSGELARTDPRELQRAYALARAHARARARREALRAQPPSPPPEA
ncbi:hypothetical protein [Tahibacter harae]|uniref:Transmembrane protein n=1 Tax=Tahibacter harae TaxID=2963937 RepID=A0ABT1QXV7_9GAMM|nr:hypothetical protein [Tahibacter harae]MCQ4167129.1 hypothetical protein [Tahibacter harae]